MLAPSGVLGQSHVGSGRKPGPGQGVGVLDKQVGRRPAVRSRIEVSFHTEMNLRAIKGDEAVSAAVPSSIASDGLGPQISRRSSFTQASPGEGVATIPFVVER